MVWGLFAFGLMFFIFFLVETICFNRKFPWSHPVKQIAIGFIFGCLLGGVLLLSGCAEMPMQPLCPDIHIRFCPTR